MRGWPWVGMTSTFSHADAAQFIGDEIGGFLNVGLVFVEGADAGNAEKVFEFVEKTLLIIAGKLDCGGSHGLVLSGARAQ